MSKSEVVQQLQCPTRPDGGDPLICHQIDRALCQSRQRALYHKCFTCAHRNDTGKPPKPLASVLPPLHTPEIQIEPVPLRIDRAG